MIDLWRNQLQKYQTIYLGLSGGLDSMVLLHQIRQCHELAPKLVALHVHHGLSPNASGWQIHCETICQRLNIPIRVFHVQLDDTKNIEEQARNERYRVFSSCIQADDVLLLAHHQDDQAETVLLQLFRGTGVHGLAAMPKMRHFAKGVLIRPLLDYNRDALQQYAITHQIDWIEDESNHSIQFSRNYIRHELMPLLRRRWPNVTENIAFCSKICQNARDNLEALANIDAQLDSDVLVLNDLYLGDTARMLNILHVWLHRRTGSSPSFRHLHRLMNEVILVPDDKRPMLAWGDVCVRRYRQRLYLEKRIGWHKEPMSVSAQKIWNQFPKAISWGGAMEMVAIPASQGVFIADGAQIEIRTRQGGERIRHNGHLRCLKKLFQAWGIPPWQRGSIPLVFIDGVLKVIVGYAMADEVESDASQTSMRFMIMLRSKEPSDEQIIDQNEREES